MSIIKRMTCSDCGEDLKFDIALDDDELIVEVSPCDSCLEDATGGAGTGQ